MKILRDLRQTETTEFTVSGWGSIYYVISVYMIHSFWVIVSVSRLNLIILQCSDMYSLHRPPLNCVSRERFVFVSKMEVSPSSLP